MKRIKQFKFSSSILLFFCNMVLLFFCNTIRATVALLLRPLPPWDWVLCYPEDVPCVGHLRATKNIRELRSPTSIWLIILRSARLQHCSARLLCSRPSLGQTDDSSIDCYVLVHCSSIAQPDCSVLSRLCSLEYRFNLQQDRWRNPVFFTFAHQRMSRASGIFCDVLFRSAPYVRLSVLIAERLRLFSHQDLFDSPGFHSVDHHYNRMSLGASFSSSLFVVIFCEANFSSVAKP